MPKKARELKPVALSNLKAGRRHAVGGVPGLYLQIPDPAKPFADGRVRTERSWLLRVVVHGKRRDIGLGPYPEVGLSDARDRARAMRAKVFAGADPLAERKAARSIAAAAAAAAVSFKTAATQYIEVKSPEWRNPKHRTQWENTLSTYAYPVIGDLDVADIATSHVLSVLQPIWSTKTETAVRLRGRIYEVIKAADSAAGRERLNPARMDAMTILPDAAKVAERKHQPALPVELMHDFMERLRSVEGQGARALQFIILTASRSGEARCATWKEIDFDKRLWSIPGKNTKSGRPHRVPLSGAAVDLLVAQGQGKPNDLIFKGLKPLQPLSDMTISAAIKRMNVADKNRWVDPKQDDRPVVPHGFRSSFRDWVRNRTNYPRDLAEAALAHVIADKTEAAYARSDMLDKRVAMMEAWAEFIDTEPGKTATVTPIRRTTKRA